MTPPNEPDHLLELLRGRRLVVLSGAGISTESGIPDYRGADGHMRVRAPLQYGEFVKQPATRVRYWARSAVGWPRMAGALPNQAHEALARLEAAGVVRGIITQNVDGLHQAAGSRRVVELHGSLAFVRCLDCGDRIERNRLQDLIFDLNPGWSHGTAVIRPDGDAEFAQDALPGFRVPDCGGCGGTLKPDVVLFGENVPPDRLSEAWRLFDEAEVLLVVGSSLTVYSGRRFLYRAQKDGVAIAIVNLGPTRGDELASVRLEGRLGDVLPVLAETLLGPS